MKTNDLKQAVDGALGAVRRLNKILTELKPVSQ